MRTDLSVKLSSQSRGWRIEAGVNGQVDTGRIFGCSDGFLPVFSAFRAAELNYRGIRATPEAYAGTLPATVTVTMPSGRRLVFVLAGVEPPEGEVPEPLL